MTTEGLKNIYPKNLAPIDDKALDLYLTGIPPSETYNVPAEVVKRPANITESLARVADAARSIETSRRLISFHGSVLKKVLEQNPDTLSNLSEDERNMVLELVSRMAASTGMPTEEDMASLWQHMTEESKLDQSVIQRIGVEWGSEAPEPYKELFKNLRPDTDSHRLVSKTIDDDQGLTPEQRYVLHHLLQRSWDFLVMSQAKEGFND